MANERLQAKDLITVGVFTAIIFIICFAVSMLGFIPIFIPLLTVIEPLVCAIPFMLFIAKCRKFGAVLILTVIEGLVMSLGGEGIWVLITAPVAGLIAELFLRKGNYSSKKWSIAAYAAYSCWVIGNYLPIVISRDSYYEMLIGGYGQEYADKLMALIPDWMLLPLLLCCIVFGIIGGIIGVKVGKKHFQRAGIV